MATVADVLKDIRAKDVKKLEQRVKKKAKGLLGTCVDPQSAERKFTPLHYAAESGNEKAVEILLRAGAEVNAVDSYGATPLLCAILSWEKDPENCEIVIDHLLKCKADPNKPNSKGDSPLSIAASQNNEQLFKKLIESGAIPNEIGVLQAAAAKGNPQILTMALTNGAKVDMQDSDGCTPLMLLVENNHIAAAKEIVSACNGGDAINMDVQDKGKGRTVLMIACEKEEPDMDLVTTLLEKGASVDVQDKEKDGAILQCIRTEKWAVVHTLISKTEKVDLKNSKGETALSLALSAGRDDVVEGLLSKGADVGNRAAKMLKAALEKKNDGMVSQLIKVAKPKVLMDLDISFESLVSAGLGKSPVAYLERFEEDEGPLDDTPIDDDGNTHLHNIAKEGGNYSLAGELIKKGLCPDKQNRNGDTPLHVAAKAGNVEVCKALIDGGADALARNKKNRTPRGQVKVPQEAKDYLLDAEEEAKNKKSEKNSMLWDDKMKATQTESAFGLRVV